jgi:hypothetical protein
MSGAQAWSPPPLAGASTSAVIQAQIHIVPKGCVHKGPQSVKNGKTYYGVQCTGGGDCMCSYNQCGKDVTGVKCTATPG